jgi:3-oxoacyl-[acyl-carrier-protein] synthase-3
MSVKIASLGKFLPERVVTNQDLTKVMDTSDEWIQARSGILERRFVTPDQTTSDLAYHAASSALSKVNLSAKDLDFILFATLSPDHMFPGNASFLQEKLDCPGIPAMDLRAQCSGFLYSLEVGRSLIQNGNYRRGLVVGAEIHSKGMDFTTEGRDVAVLFGDGAGAVILEHSDHETGIIDVVLGADGRFARDLWVEAPGMFYEKWDITEEMRSNRSIFPHMNGKKVFQAATTKMEEMAKHFLQKHTLKQQDIAQVICHQANARIIDFVRKSLEWEPEKFFINIDKYGNTTAASIPIALCEAIEMGKVRNGDLVLLMAFGSGFTWGSALVRI